MKRSAKMLLVVVGFILGLLILGPVVWPWFSVWSRINCEVQEINIRTGRARFRRYIWYIEVSERTEGTLVSKLLDGREVEVADTEPWQTVNTFCPPGASYSPHHSYHSALYQIQRLGLIFEAADVSRAKRVEHAEELLELWQRDRSDGKAGDFVNRLDVEYLAEPELDGRSAARRSRVTQTRAICHADFRQKCPACRTRKPMAR